MDNKSGLPIIVHYTYCILDNGRLQEDTSHEFCAYAGHLGITIDSPTKLSFTEGVATRYEVDYDTYCIMGDGGLQEDLFREVCAYAGHPALGSFRVLGRQRQRRRQPHRALARRT